MADLLATTENFAIVLEGRRATVKVWRRPDLDTATGARLAEELGERVKALPGRGVVEIVLDLREAPPVSGPRTTAAIGKLLASLEAASTRIAVRVGPEAIQALQIRRLMTENAPRNARLVNDEAEVERWFNRSA